MSSFSKKLPASCQLQSLYMQHSLEFEFFIPPPPNLDPSQGMFTLMFLVLSSVSSFPRFCLASLQDLHFSPMLARACDHCKALKCRCVRGDGGDSTYCKRCLQDNKECIVSESRRINRPRGPKPGAKGKSRSTQFDQDRNMSASDFQDGITGSLRSPEPIESSSGVYPIMPDQNPDLVPHLISNAMNDHAHYAMAYNVASVSYSPWYNYETQTYDHYGESVEAGNSSGADSWRMEGHSGNNQFSSQESYTAYNTWDGSVSFTEPQSYIADDDFQKRWNYSYSRNL
ncbi:hypothetical protein C8J55DRAFT_566216 [Lentinula edodes]|uniref:Zn(2)-C6 fungal-type domain-containing protein n=1 Tax=Lentinula lateritia TaxID=40482 RepID=A0A9W8ZTW6_9AGAR|nr:hypothetical protein C8J55DRAFT_566216 [Lentinula edodes]